MSRPTYQPYPTGSPPLSRPRPVPTHNAYQGPADRPRPPYNPNNAGPSARPAYRPQASSGSSSHNNPRPSGSGSRSNRASMDSNAWMGLSLHELPFENQRQIERCAQNLATWESVALMSVSRNESMPQARHRETLTMIRAADCAPPPPSQPQSAPYPSPYIGTTYQARSHDPPPIPGSSNNASSSHHHHHQLPRHASSSSSLNRHGSSSSKKSSSRAQNNSSSSNSAPSPDLWNDVVGVAWEDRFKPVPRNDVRRASEGRSGSGSGSGKGRAEGSGKGKEGKGNAGGSGSGSRKRPR